jgi:hypothetical protein
MSIKYGQEFRLILGHDAYDLKTPFAIKWHHIKVDHDLS